MDTVSARPINNIRIFDNIRILGYLVTGLNPNAAVKLPRKGESNEIKSRINKANVGTVPECLIEHVITETIRSESHYNSIGIIDINSMKILACI